MQECSGTWKKEKADKQGKAKQTLIRQSQYLQISEIQILE